MEINFLALFLCHTDEHDDSFRYLARANNRSEYIWKMYFKYVIPANACLLAIPSICSALFCYIINGKLIVDHLFIPLKAE